MRGSGSCGRSAGAKALRRDQRRRAAAGGVGYGGCKEGAGRRGFAVVACGGDVGEEWEMGHEAEGGAGSSTAGVGGGLEVSPAGARGGGPGWEEASNAVARFG